MNKYTEIILNTNLERKAIINHSFYERICEKKQISRGYVVDFCINIQPFDESVIRLYYDDSAIEVIEFIFIGVQKVINYFNARSIELCGLQIDITKCFIHEADFRPNQYEFFTSFALIRLLELVAQKVFKTKKYIQSPIPFNKLVHDYEVLKDTNIIVSSHFVSRQFENTLALKEIIETNINIEGSDNNKLKIKLIPVYTARQRGQIKVYTEFRKENIEIGYYVCQAVKNFREDIEKFNKLNLGGFNFYFEFTASKIYDFQLLTSEIHWKLKEIYLSEALITSPPES